ncbi:glycosyltransferase family 2 protein [Patescibacteria group bacterium]|nr:glycosyltransferase family 2 protein [Patescibacteria group bacterium]
MKKQKNQLTAVVLVKDEAENLPRCLKSLRFVDELIVLDDESTDDSVKVAEKFGAKVYHRKLDDFASQRNFVLGKVRTEWVLMIDPDEEVSSELNREIINAIREEKYNGFKFPRKNLMFGHWVEHAGWWPDFQLHLFRAKKGEYHELVHEQVVVEGKVGELNSPLLHHNYENISHFISTRKFDLYTSLEARQLYKSDYEFFWFDLVGKPADEFLRRFFAEKGYQDGLVGLLLSLLQAGKELVVFAKVWELSGKKNNLTGKKMLEELGGRIVVKAKEFGYWFSTAVIDLTEDKLKKTFLRIKRRLED